MDEAFIAEHPDLPRDLIALMIEKQVAHLQGSHSVLRGIMDNHTAEE